MPNYDATATFAAGIGPPTRAAKTLLLVVLITMFYVEAVPRSGGGSGNNGAGERRWLFGWPQNCVERIESFNYNMNTSSSAWSISLKALAIDLIVTASIVFVPAYRVGRQHSSHRQWRFSLRRLFALTCVMAVAIAVAAMRDEYGEPDWQYCWWKLLKCNPPITLRTLLVGACVIAEVAYLTKILLARRAAARAVAFQPQAE